MKRKTRRSRRVGFCNLFGLLVLCLAGCSGDEDWRLVRKQDFPSPDGHQVATVFEMDGNTTGFYPQVTVRRPNEKLGKLGNVLQGGPGDGASVRWLSPTNLLVKYYAAEGGLDSAIKTTNVFGVAIAFTKVTRPEGL
jgi:hypothetical protein